MSAVTPTGLLLVQRPVARGLAVGKGQAHRLARIFDDAQFAFFLLPVGQNDLPQSVERGQAFFQTGGFADQLAKGDQAFLELTDKKSAGEKLFKIAPSGFQRVKNAFFKPTDWEEAQLFL